MRRVLVGVLLMVVAGSASVSPAAAASIASPSGSSAPGVEPIPPANAATKANVGLAAAAGEWTGELVGTGHYTPDSLSARSVCPASASAIGMRIGLDDRGFVAFVAMVCRRAGQEVSPESSIGDPSFSASRSSSREGPAVPVGIYGYAGDILDGVGIRCNEVGNVASDGPLVWGGGGANRGDFGCPPGASLNGLTGVDAAYFGGRVVAGLRGLCSSLVAPVISRAASCSAVLVQDPSARDGTYSIDVAGRRFAVYCRNMQRARRGSVPAPSQYISLPATGAGENVSEYVASREPHRRRLLRLGGSGLDLQPLRPKPAA
jgi:hypothetical protein